MDASKFGFGADTHPAFKFDPSDADLAAHYLLPRALGLPNPHAHAIHEEDPGGAPPWEILARHGQHANSEYPVHAFFFGPPADASHNGGRRCRTVPGGGVWQGQKGIEETVVLLRPGGGEVDIRFKRYNLTFCRVKGGPSTGYIMHEYEILSPPLPGTVLTRIKASKGARGPADPDDDADGDADAEQKPVIQVPDDPSHDGYEYDDAAANGKGFADGADEQKAVIPVPDPSHEHDADAAKGEGFAGALDGALLLDSKGRDGSANYTCPLRYDLPVVDYDGRYRAPIQYQPGASYNYNAAAMMGDGEGFAGSQLQDHAFFYGAGMAEAAGACYDEYDPSSVLEFGAEFSDYFSDYQQWQYQLEPSNQCQQEPMSNQCQQEPSNQCQAGDAAVMGAGSEVIPGEQQTGAPCGNGDKGTVVGTEASKHSTISQCGNGEKGCDDTTFLNTMHGMGEDDKREQNDAGR